MFQSIVDDNDTRIKQDLSDRPTLSSSAKYKVQETDDKMLNQSTLSEDTSSAAISIEDDWRVISEKMLEMIATTTLGLLKNVLILYLQKNNAALLVKLKHFAQTTIRRLLWSSKCENRRRSTSGAYTHHAKLAQRSISRLNPSNGQILIFLRARLFEIVMLTGSSTPFILRLPQLGNPCTTYVSAFLSYLLRGETLSTTPLMKLGCISSY